MKVYMKVTNDKYELPLAVADSKAALSLMLGLERSAVAKTLNRARAEGKECIYKEVEIDDE